MASLGPRIEELPTSSDSLSDSDGDDVFFDALAGEEEDGDGEEDVFADAIADAASAAAAGAVVKEEEEASPPPSSSPPPPSSSPPPPSSSPPPPSSSPPPPSSSPPPPSSVVAEEGTGAGASAGAEASAEEGAEADASASARASDGEEAAVVLTPEQRKEAEDKATALKEEGNELFRAGAHDDAIDRYSKAIAAAPQDSPLIAVFHANRAACYVVQERWEESVADCTVAIKINPDYTRAYTRRAKSREALDRLRGALEDWTVVAEKEPSNAVAVRKTRTLPPLVAEQEERQKEEALGKLKDLGNTILGKFGMSLDNFQMVQDPQSGGYSINFKQ